MNQICAKKPRTRRPAQIPATGWFSMGTCRAACASAGLAAAATAGAFEAADLLGFRAGPVTFKPQLSTTAGYNDNIYSTATDSPFFGRTSDFLFSVSPGVLIEMGREGGNANLNLSYNFTQYLYVENTQNDSGNHFITLSSTLQGARVSNTASASIQLLDSLMTGQDYANSGIDAPNRRNVERNFYSFNDTVSYELGPKSKLNGGGSFSMQEYPGGLQGADLRYRDTTSWGIFGGYQREVTEKLSATSNLRYGQSNQQPNALGNDGLDQQNFSATVGATGNITPKLSGGVNVGYQYNWYDGEQGAQGGIIVGMSLSQKFSDRTSATLSYNRSSSLASSGLRSPTTVNSASAGVQHALGTRRPIVLNAGITYSLTDYITDSRSQEFFSATAGVSYQFRTWASAFLSYSYNYGTYPGFQVGPVNLTDAPYYVNQVTLGINIGLK